ncbi:hypothetical protein EMEDMD4_90185 [Sinorhizobium medicae]|uniref:Uncharacterized protein n=1 Tax=Sinorhizobium medicae TaxID=110321 RepID=A0A508X7F4_9HYPH|nr:hypothetical protein EMEDMD4_90185 [Sinorhizobium medicae]
MRQLSASAARSTVSLLEAEEKSEFCIAELCVSDIAAIHPSAVSRKRRRQGSARSIFIQDERFRAR